MKDFHRASSNTSDTANTVYQSQRAPTPPGPNPSHLSEVHHATDRAPEPRARLFAPLTMGWKLRGPAKDSSTQPQAQLLLETLAPGCYQAGSFPELVAVWISTSKFRRIPATNKFVLFCMKKPVIGKLGHLSIQTPEYY